MEELCPLFSVLAVNINLPDFYLGLWGFSAKYLGGKALSGSELWIIKEKKLISKTFARFPSLGIKNCFLFKVKLLFLCNSVLPGREIQEMCY